MIKFNLSVLLAERNISITKLSEVTQISRNTLTLINNGKTQGIQLETMNKLCHFLKITPGELFTYLPFDLEIVDINFSGKKSQGILTIKLSNFINSLEIPIYFSCNFGVKQHPTKDLFFINAHFHFFIEDTKWTIDPTILEFKNYLKNLPLQFFNILNENFTELFYKKYSQKFKNSSDEDNFRKIFYSYDWDTVTNFFQINL
ncbi:helix-turn-helix domain-containing protein [Fusobacterium necrophorum]|uniref:helix-turn-helix domain-containing protein n=1 Tax=Fusobacterium necrophorum TaxID=859 RepID=UPI00254E73CF|nr:helix-turn-helix transcriptional regulator [Fusobacterium necrophorum]MDK4477060.1 helix-turn-helix transcriptional regulator [Fusobacterium necrophorum]